MTVRYRPTTLLHAYGPNAIIEPTGYPKMDLDGHRGRKPCAH